MVDLPQKLVELWANARVIKLPAADEQPDGTLPSAEPDDRAEQALHDILTTLRTQTGHDFRHYKRATVLR
ncbi:hypothetical protein SB861_70275, partial [Paraburkholderia sp. SIMBA_049]